MSTLLELLDSPHAAVRSAARSSLSEFTFERFAGAFELLNDETRVETGRLVKRVDPTAIDQLCSELSCRVRLRRIRAIEMAIAMNVVSDVETEIIAMLSDSDDVLRSEAAATLVHSDSAESRQALRNTLLDRSQAVREAAEQTLHVFATNSLHTQRVSAAAPLDLPVPATEPGREEHR